MILETSIGYRVTLQRESVRGWATPWGTAESSITLGDGSQGEIESASETELVAYLAPGRDGPTGNTESMECDVPNVITIRVSDVQVLP